jgi:hypothetical protein
MSGDKVQEPDEGGFESFELSALENCTVAQLKGFLKNAGLKAAGLKAELVDRVKVGRI